MAESKPRLPDPHDLASGLFLRDHMRRCYGSTSEFLPPAGAEMHRRFLFQVVDGERVITCRACGEEYAFTPSQAYLDREFAAWKPPTQN